MQNTHHSNLDKSLCHITNQLLSFCILGNTSIATLTAFFAHFRCKTKFFASPTTTIATWIDFIDCILFAWTVIFAETAGAHFSSCIATNTHGIAKVLLHGYTNFYITICYNQYTFVGEYPISISLLIPATVSNDLAELWFTKSSLPHPFFNMFCECNPTRIGYKGEILAIFILLALFCIITV